MVQHDCLVLVSAKAERMCTFSEVEAYQNGHQRLTLTFFFLSFFSPLLLVMVVGFSVIKLAKIWICFAFFEHFAEQSHGLEMERPGFKIISFQETATWLVSLLTSDI